VVKNPPAMQETQLRSLNQEDPLEEDMETHSGESHGEGSLAGTVYSVSKSWTQLKQLSMLIF